MRQTSVHGLLVATARLVEGACRWRDGAKTRSAAAGMAPPVAERQGTRKRGNIGAGVVFFLGMTAPVAGQSAYWRYPLSVDVTLDAAITPALLRTATAPGNVPAFKPVATKEADAREAEGEAQALAIEPGLVQGRSVQLKFEIMILAILCLIHFLRLRAVAGRARIAAAAARLRERERIARELHDTLLQGFQGLMLRLQAVAERVKHEPEQAHELIEQAMLRVDAVLEEGRDRVIGLRANNKSPLELSQSLLRVAEDVRSHPTKVRVTVQGTIRELQANVRDEAEWIGIEAMSNALHHARASTIDVGILFHPRQFALRISDDGVGIDPAILDAGRERHFGLAGMRERARSVRGRISIASRSGGGTQIELIICASAAYPKRRALTEW